jgi:hypothetical protein
MSDEMRKKLYGAAYTAVAHECVHVGRDQVVGLVEDHDRCPDCYRQAVAAVQAVLKVLTDEHFPDDDVEYQYACEGLAMDVCEALCEIRGEESPRQ